MWISVNGNVALRLTFYLSRPEKNENNASKVTHHDDDRR